MIWFIVDYNMWCNLSNMNVRLNVYVVVLLVRFFFVLW